MRLPRKPAAAEAARPARPQAPLPPATVREDIALVLGGGGARGLAHIAVVEALDELGVRPARIVGTSMGAVVGAAYAAGLTAREMREHAVSIFANRPALVAGLLKARVGRLLDLRGLGSPVLVDGERLLDLFWPDAIPDHFEDLVTPFAAIATDFYRQESVTLRAGPLTPAVAASLALPGIVRPVVIGGRVLVDGGATEPLPIGEVAAQGFKVVAVDVSVPPAAPPEPAIPAAFEALVGVAQILTRTLTQRLLEQRSPDVLIRAGQAGVVGLDFLKTEAILTASVPIKEEAKRKIAALLESA